jgi:site-specific recombinase XerD
MAYSIKLKMHPYADASGLHKVMLQVLYERKNAYLPLPFKVLERDFTPMGIINHPLKKAYNETIKSESLKLETRLLDAIKAGAFNLKDVVQGKQKTSSIVEFILDLADELEKRKGKKDGVVRHIRSVANKVNPAATFSQVSVKWLNDFETRLHGLKNRGGDKIDGNTIHANMKRLKGIMVLAEEQGLVTKQQYEKYKVPKYEQKEPVYLTEKEIDQLHAFAEKVGDASHKLATFYFLLSCYAGYRISDLKKFDYNKMVQDDRVVLRAHKNKSIVSMPIHGRLQRVLDYIKDKPLKLSEQKVREYVKAVAKLAGITKDVKIHSGRHSFAMMLMANEFSLAEVARYLGDSKDVAAIYGRIIDTHSDKKVMDRLG